MQVVQNAFTIHKEAADEELVVLEGAPANKQQLEKFKRLQILEKVSEMINDEKKAIKAVGNMEIMRKRNQEHLL